MGRKWTNIKFVLEDRDDTIQEASANPKTQQEALHTFLTERWDDENVYPMEHIDVMFGNLSTDKLKRYMQEIFEECGFIEQAGVVFVTDSAHIGYGYVFEREDGTAELIEEYTGYEGAEGHDVAGRITDDYRIKVSPEWYWD